MLLRDRDRAGTTMRARASEFLRTNSLSLVFGLLFLLVLVGQAFAGQAEVNDERAAHDLPNLSFWAYVTSSGFAVDVTENWQSEFLQFTLFILGTVWLLQRGSPESKPLDRAGSESDREMKVGQFAQDDSPKWARAGGWRTASYSNSLGLVMFALFLLAWTAQAVSGWAAYNSQRLGDLRPPKAFGDYLTSAEFWNRSLQNWQSELLAIGSMVVLSVYLRQRGSPESKPVGESHDATGRTG